MELGNLRAEILKLTAGNKFFQSKAFSRTFFIILSPQMEHLKKWFETWFPLPDESLYDIYQWVVLEDSHEDEISIERDVQNAWQTAFSVKTLNRLTTKGYQIIDTANQVILLGDLTDTNIMRKLELVQKAFFEILHKWGVSTIPIYWVGLFLIRNLDITEDGKTEIRHAVNLADFKKWAKENLDKLFLIDISNRFGTVVSDSKDLHYLIGQLIYILVKKPIEFAETFRAEAFTEWIKRGSPQEGKVAGFSGISILIPIDQILETLLLRKGAELLENAFLGEIPEEKVDLYYSLIVGKHYLNSTDTLYDYLLKSSDYPLVDPFTSNGKNEAVEFDINQPDIFLKYIETLSSSFDKYLDNNKNLLKNLLNKHLEEFKFTLADLTDAIITKEKNGILIAESFLQRLQSHLSELMESLKSQPLPSFKIDNQLKDLKTELLTGPRKESTIARLSLLLLIMILGMFLSPKLLDKKMVFLSIVSIIFFVIGLVQLNAWENRVERLVSSIWKQLQERWKSAMGKMFQDLLKEILPAYIEAVEEILSKVSAAKERLQEIIEFFKINYIAKVPEESAFWVYVTDYEKELDKYLSLIKIDLPSHTPEYILGEKLAGQWNRFSPPGESEFNKWEWKIIEEASLKVAPFAAEIANISICEMLRSLPDKFESFKELVGRASSPFLILKPNFSSTGGTIGTFEIPPEKCDDIFNELEHAVSGNFSSLKKMNSNSIYRISLFCFYEGVGIDSVQMEE